MQGKIALEEHFAIPETLAHSAGVLPDESWGELSARLLDIGTFFDPQKVLEAIAVAGASRRSAPRCGRATSCPTRLRTSAYPNLRRSPVVCKRRAAATRNDAVSNE